MSEPAYDFDVAVTFAGEDRAFVEQVVHLMKADGFSVFYDEDAKVSSWGTDLTEYFSDVYEKRARYAIMFISGNYASKAWTRMERRSVLARALTTASPYVLPVRLDSTPLPGVRETIGYLDGIAEGPSGIATAVRAKLRLTEETGNRQFNGRVPRTDQELTVLMGERPDGWEYLLFSFWLSNKLSQLSAEYNDHAIQYASIGEPVPNESLIGHARLQLARLTSITSSFDALLAGPPLVRAIGAHGEDGDPDLILHLADRLISIYKELLRWSYDLRAAVTWGEEGREVLRSLSEYASQPVDAIREFVESFKDRMDRVSDEAAGSEEVKIVFEITWSIPEDTKERYNTALSRFAKTLE
ncbi:toll/interleukin-1 receptor domain-containing protein [Microbacterium saperdae]|uniref:TIR domain-containing protein n=1 Tax=Microbacterium saperdae TaxID=69368 RepID=A0A543BB67_9MICO|nr:TIR domain-containing protein [Microbacterium saperdae]TQL82095.1 TIR domain-containing protein [Microbacterium saperdae]GGM37168.1 hypothetical protein GCM10010489_05140 [Microbacterium saperdae]